MVHGHGLVNGAGTASVLKRGVNETVPHHSRSGCWEGERNLFMMSVHEEHKILIGDELAAFIDFIHRRTREKKTKSSGVLLVPFLIGHLPTVGPEPENVLDPRAFDGTSLEEIPSAEDWMVLAERNKSPNESHQFFFAAELLPIHPADFVVLTVGVVVPLLCAAELIAGEEHGDSLG